MNPIAQECIALIAKQKDLPPEQISLESSLEELGLDSLDRVSIVFDLEDKYKIEISDDQLDAVKTVRDMVTGIERALAQKSAAPSPAAPS